MARIVVDSSIIVKWLNQKDEKYLKQAEMILKDVQAGRIELLTVDLAIYEVGNALLLGKKISPEEAQEAFNFLFNLPIMMMHQDERRAGETFNLAEKSSLTYYDAAFVALAKDFNAVLVTDNIKHQGKVSEVKVIPLKDYK